VRIAYLTGRYPEVSHTFIMREVGALRRLGVDVRTFSLWRTSDAQLVSEADRVEHERTYHVLPLRACHVLAAVSRALLTRPRRLASTVIRALRLARPGARGLAMGALWSLEAAIIWDRCCRVGVRHLHAHLNGSAPSVALLAAHLGNDPGERRAWTWSLTVHGPAEFYDVAGEALEAKVRDADVVVAISDFARSQLMALVDHSCWEKIRVVHCGVDPRAFAPVSPGERRHGPLRILNVSRLAPTKGNAVLLEAIADLARRGVDVAATVVGDGVERDRLERLAARLGVGERVTFAGAVGQDVIRQYYLDADVFCLPSFAEGVPIVLMEAMAMQLPVVATRVMGVGELVEDRVNGLLLPPGRSDLLADAVASLAADADLRQRLGQSGRQKVLADFALDASAEQLERIFASVLGRATR
jgi:glycosyltransferase involved in cell wall biosynthesis